jgi:tripartite-type tricarboxylate transporter receptor subunit TctC
MKLAGEVKVKALIAMAAALLAGLPVFVQAQAAAAYPSRAVRIVVPFPPGGATDTIARLVGQRLSESWRHPVVIDNRSGATGAVGSEHVARAAADGYTVLMGTASTHSVSPAVNTKLPYKLADYAPVSLVATFPNMLVVHPSVPARSVSELVALIKANPGKYNFGSSGIAGSIHLSGELFKLMTGTDMVHVPYKGSAPALNDLLAGQIQMMFDNMTTVWPHAQAGRLRALGVAGLERSPAAPDVPAIAETLPGFEANSWVGFFVPAGTPPEIVGRISTETRNAVSVPEVRQKLRELGAQSVGSTADAFAAFVRADTEKWRKVAAAARVSAE